jgi:hypothetical protein
MKHTVRSKDHLPYYYLHFQFTYCFLMKNIFFFLQKVSFDAFKLSLVTCGDWGIDWTLRIVLN